MDGGPQTADGGRQKWTMDGGRWSGRWI